MTHFWQTRLAEGWSTREGDSGAPDVALFETADAVDALRRGPPHSDRAPIARNTLPVPAPPPHMGLAQVQDGGRLAQSPRA
jgi:hypothetical protein